MHPDFIEIVSKVKGYYRTVLVTNLSFDVVPLIQACRENGTRLIVQPSFHFEYADFDAFINNMRILDQNGMLSHFIPVSIVDLPDRPEPREWQHRFNEEGYQAALYQFEGYYKGTFDYADVNGFGARGKRPPVLCHSVCHCIRPNGDILFCPTYYYHKDPPTFGNMCDRRYQEIPHKRVCSEYGMCHISSAAWSGMESLDGERVLWQGKNLRRSTFLGVWARYGKAKLFGL